MLAKRSLKHRLFVAAIFGGCCVLIALFAALIKLNPKPISPEGAARVAAADASIQESLARHRSKLQAARPAAEAGDTTAVLQAACDGAYLGLLAAIDRLGSRSELTTNTAARAELIRLARELGQYYDHRMTISPEVRRHKPQHVQIIFDLGRIIMQGDRENSLLTMVRPPFTPEFRKQMNDAEPIEVLKTKFMDAAKAYYVLDLAAPFSLEYHDSRFIGDSPVMRATQNLLALYGDDSGHFGPLLNGIDPELVARRRAPDLAPMLGELIESSAWVSQQYYDRTATWDGAVDLFHEHIQNEILARKMRLITNGDMLYQLWNRDELRVKETEWLADVASRAGSIHNWSDLQSPTHPRTDPDGVVGDEAMTNALNQIQQARLQAAALEIIQGVPIPDKPGPDSYFYNCSSQSVIGVFPAVSNGNHYIGLNSYAVWNTGNRNYMQQSNGVVWLKLPPDHPALKSIK
ncbi:MAG: hypothetical protein ABFD69_13425 [Candidatus Sumerlaeia bacterium]